MKCRKIFVYVYLIYTSGSSLGQLFVDTLAVILRKQSEIVVENFFQRSKCNFVNYVEISGNRCANTNLH